MTEPPVNRHQRVYGVVYGGRARDVARACRLRWASVLAQEALSRLIRFV
jgi:hypothetical protein